MKTIIFQVIDSQRHTSSFRRNVLYPLAVLLLLLLTGIAVLMVLQNTLELLVGFKALPISTSVKIQKNHCRKYYCISFCIEFSAIYFRDSVFVQTGSGRSSYRGCRSFVFSCCVLHWFVWLCTASSSSSCTHPFVSPRGELCDASHFEFSTAGACQNFRFDYHFIHISYVQVALHHLSFFVGVTNFDLLGDFGSIEWLGNFKLVLLYNLVFATAATLCLINKFTATVRRELYNRLVENVNILSDCVTFLNWPVVCVSPLCDFLDISKILCDYDAFLFRKV